MKKYAIAKDESVGMVESVSWYYNAFMQDNAGKLWRLENKQDVIDMIKPIDTPAEIRLVLWLDSKIYSTNYDKYKKSANGYIIPEYAVEITNLLQIISFGIYKKISINLLG